MENVDISKGELFPGQDPNEKCYLFIRRHWIVFIVNIFVLAGMLILPFIVLFILRFSLPGFFQGSVTNIVLVLASMYILSICGLILVSFITYYFDIVIITDRRIVDINQQRLFNRTIDELELLHIEDVASHQKGIIATFFDYGTITVQTAGAARNFVFQYIPHPQKIARQIMILYEKATQIDSERLEHINRREGLGKTTYLKQLADDSFQSKLVDESLGKFQPPSISKNEIPNHFAGEIKKGEVIDLNKTTETKILLKFNIRESNLNEVLKILPSLKSPTINSLADKDFVAVETVVNKSQLSDLIPQIKDRGATDIIESEIELL